MPAIKPVLLGLWGRVRGTLRPLASPLAFVFGWFPLALKALDAISRLQTIHFLSGSTMDLIGWLRDWGWLLGIIWLGFLVVRASSKPGAAEQERAKRNVEDTLAHSLVRFEALLYSHLGALNASKDSEIQEAYRQLLSALRHLSTEISVAQRVDADLRIRELLEGAYLKLLLYNREHEQAREIVKHLLGVDQSQATPSVSPASSKASGPDRQP
jgi:hypothetical protein